MNIKKLTLAVLTASLPLSVAIAESTEELGNKPLIGTVYNSSKILYSGIFNSMEFGLDASRDLSLFTAGSVTLDTLILTLPLEAKVKTRVMGQLTNPRYSIQLGHLLYSFYDKYTGEVVNQDIFRQHLLTIYSEEELKPWQHTLFTLEEAPESSESAQESAVTMNRTFIAALVTLYDALFGKDKLLYGDEIPDQYQYLTDSEQDWQTVARVQNILIATLSNYSDSLPEGDIKAAVQAIIEDGKPENQNKPNNKAQAITISLVDFVRLTVIKGYRQFLLEQAKANSLNDWMQELFDEDPNKLISYLLHQNHRPLAVQITVDGLQQGLMQALVSPEPSRFLQQVMADEDNAQSMAPRGMDVTAPEHIPDNSFAAQLARKPMTDPRYLPYFKSIYRNYRAGIVEFGVSTTPTISVRNLPIIKTGADVAGPGGTGIPNFHFVDRHQDRAYYFFGNDALQLDRIFADNGARTQFERLVPMVTLNCNAQYDWYAESSFEPLINLGVGEAIRDFGEQRCLKELERRGEQEVNLQQARLDLIDMIADHSEISWWTPATRVSKSLRIEQLIREYADKSQQGLPDFVLAYNPWPDHFAHFTGPFANEILAPTGELNRLDYWLGQMDKVYRDAGVYDRVLWGMAGDHGLTPIHHIVNPEQQVFDGISSDHDVSLKIRKISSDEGEGPKITHTFNYPSNRGIDLIVASTAGGNYMIDLFNSAQGWQTQPVLTEINQWRPLNGAEDAAPIELLSEITDRLGDSLDYLAVRESACNLQTCTLRLQALHNGKLLDERITRIGNKSLYQSLNGNPPELLQLYELNPYADELSEPEQAQRQKLLDACMTKAVTNKPETWCDATQWRQLTRFSPRPDSVNQLAHLYDEDRAGTINLFPAQGIGFNTKVPGRHAGEHFHEKDAFIGFWGTPVTTRQPIATAVNGSLAPTIYQYLTNYPVVAGEDGWGFPSLWPQLQSDNSK
ncbi:alkaline phosphatase family protein [Shewanella corallii]|uniref:Alkaline phosphatase family protein n=1 Tax=Shewanella corallii TaxID=560080 RepID=A0ABT0NCZ0_9GAMM|nr:alkaline phosphatase family protein [Shewanella corallii]MCL2916344.1 alkaline phosphatase family protein [Shewanella corallii]